MKPLRSVDASLTSFRRGRSCGARRILLPWEEHNYILPRGLISSWSKPNSRDPAPLNVPRGCYATKVQKLASWHYRAVPRPYITTSRQALGFFCVMMRDSPAEAAWVIDIDFNCKGFGVTILSRNSSAAFVWGCNIAASEEKKDHRKSDAVELWSH